MRGRDSYLYPRLTCRTSPESKRDTNKNKKGEEFIMLFIRHLLLPNLRDPSSVDLPEVSSFFCFLVLCMFVQIVKPSEAYWAIQIQVNWICRKGLPNVRRWGRLYLPQSHGEPNLPNLSHKAAQSQRSLQPDGPYRTVSLVISIMTRWHSCPK